VEDAIISADREQQIVFFNQAAERVFGYATGEIRGKALNALLPSAFVRHRGAHVVEFPRSPQASQPKPVRHEIVARRKNGEEFPAEASFSEFPAEDGWSLTVILQDITGRTERVAGAAPTRLEDNPDCLGTTDFIANSKSMRQLLLFADRVSASEASTILIEGESGVGKDVLARFIHENSRRRSHAFLAVNCAAIPETLLESELFGYE
jgi:PAS domain S-box-containing protein